MNSYQSELYNNLRHLCDTNDSFYYKDFPANTVTYRIFNYRFASMSDFMLPSAMECRGVMFEVVDGSNTANRLVALPMEKFFNLYENELTMDLDLTTATNVEIKADGSLISSYMENHQLKLKSKGSISSEQCIDAMKWLDQKEQCYLKSAIMVLTTAGLSVNLEWCAPFNRIVLGYDAPQLILLNVRNMSNGKYLDLFDSDCELASLPEFDILRKFHTERVSVGNPVEFVNNIPNMTGIEGYIVELESGQRVKIKTDWYVTQHRAKDSINSNRRLFEAVLAESTDDLRALFHDDKLVLERITDMENFVVKQYNLLTRTVETFYTENKELSRKDYAILGQQTLPQMQFSLVMNLYVGRTIDYKYFMSKRWKQFGLTDIRTQEIT